MADDQADATQAAAPKDGKKRKTDAGAADSGDSKKKAKGGKKAAKASAETVFMINDAKRVAVNLFKGRVLVNIREFYQAAGQWLPGKKGIAVNPADWATITGAAPAISTALAAVDTKFSQDLTTMRKVTVSAFQKSTYVQIREYYEDKATKELKPGAKGIGLRVAEWQKLCELMPAITAAANKIDKVYDDDEDAE